MSYAADAIVEEDRPLTLLDGFRLLPGGVGGLLLGGAIGMFLEWRIGETYLPYHPNRLAVLAALGIALGIVGVRLKRRDGATIARFALASVVLGVGLFAIRLALRFTFA